jgi:hypothetical protein
MNRNDIRFIYSGVCGNGCRGCTGCKGKCGVIALAYCQIGEHRGRLAAAFCSPSDQFSKRQARILAGGRLMFGYGIEFLCTKRPGYTLYEQALATFNAAVQNRTMPFLPQWAHQVKLQLTGTPPGQVSAERQECTSTG